MLLPRLGSVTAPAGTTIVSHGDPADELFLVTSGRLSVFAPGGDRRLTTLSAGMTFGELAYIERGPAHRERRRGHRRRVPHAHLRALRRALVQRARGVREAAPEHPRGRRGVAPPGERRALAPGLVALSESASPRALRPASALPARPARGPPGVRHAKIPRRSKSQSDRLTKPSVSRRPIRRESALWLRWTESASSCIRLCCSGDSASR